MDPWRRLSARELMARTVVFPAVKDIKLATYVQCLEKHGIEAEAILSVQVSSSGQCRITFTESSLAILVSKNGFVLNERHISPECLAGTPNVQLHIHDIPVWVSDGAVEAALSQYGTVQGAIRHGRLKIRDGVFIATGVRFATFKLGTNKTVPSYVKSRDGKRNFRVYHADQTTTCRLCNKPGHIAKDCPEKTQISKSTTKTSSNNRAVDSSSEHKTKNNTSLLFTESERAEVLLSDIVANRQGNQQGKESDSESDDDHQSSSSEPEDFGATPNNSDHEPLGQAVASNQTTKVHHQHRPPAQDCNLDSCEGEVNLGNSKRLRPSVDPDRPEDNGMRSRNRKKRKQPPGSASRC